jgi:hypothetical protein
MTDHIRICDRLTSIPTAVDVRRRNITTENTTDHREKIVRNENVKLAAIEKENAIFHIHTIFFAIKNRIL